MDHAATGQTATVPLSADDFTWRAHPAFERRSQAFAAGGAIMTFVLFTLISFGPGWAVLSLAVLVFSLNRFFFPSRFTIDDNGIVAKYPLRTVRIRWSDLRRFVHDARGGYLSTRAERSRLDAFTGVHILFGNQRDAVITRIRKRIPKGAVA